MYHTAPYLPPPCAYKLEKFATNEQTNNQSINESIKNMYTNEAAQNRDSWLYRQNKKQARRGCICWAFWIGLLLFSATVVVVVLWLVKAGYFDKLAKKIQEVTT